METWMVVHESLGPLSPGSKKMLERLFRGTGRAGKLEYVPIGVSNVSAARKASEGLREKLQEADSVLALGALALMAARGDHTRPTLTNERGRLQWVGLPNGQEITLMPTLDPAIVWTDNEYFRDFGRDVIKWASTDEPVEVPFPSYLLPTTRQGLTAALHALDPYPTLSLDVETLGFDWADDELISVGVGTKDGPVVIIPHEMLASTWVATMLWDYLWLDPDTRVVLHNGVFDLKFLNGWWHGLPDGTGAKLGDTMLLHHLLDERPVRSKYKTHGLKDLARTRYDVADYSFDHSTFQARYRGDEGTEPLTEADWDLMYRYHAMDCRITAMLWDDLVPEAEEESELLLQVHDAMLMPATRAIAEAELRGVPVDIDYLKTEKDRLTRRLARRTKGLQAWVGDPDFKPGSPAQLVKVIKTRMGITDTTWPGKTSGGKQFQRKTKNPTGLGEIKQLVARFTAEVERVGKGTPQGQKRHSEARFLSSELAWRQEAKQLSTYVEGWLEAVKADGRVHPSFNLGGTVTGRLSSDHPNMQAIPKYGSMIRVRKQVKAPPGWNLLEGDYSQLELRTAAMLSQDPDLMQVYIDGRDLHLEVASMLFEKRVDNITDEERFMAKAVNFGILYGRSGWAISKGDEMTYAVEKLGMKRWSPDEGEEYIERWMEGFPVLRAWIQRMQVRASERRYTETPFGRRRRFFITRTDPAIISAFQRMAVNTPVQSTASDICLQAFCRVNDAIDRRYAHLISIVHDSVLLEVREGHEVEIATQVKTIMETPPAEWRGLPLVVDMKVGKTLSDEDMKKVGAK